MTANETEPDEGIAALGGLRERIRDHGAATDHVLAALTTARLKRRQGDQAGAVAAVDQAADAGATEPRLLALVATEARSVGRLSRAQLAAEQAAARPAIRISASSSPRFRSTDAMVLRPSEPCGACPCPIRTCSR